MGQRWFGRLCYQTVVTAATYLRQLVDTIELSSEPVCERHNAGWRGRNRVSVCLSAGVADAIGRSMCRTVGQQLTVSSLADRVSSQREHHIAFYLVLHTLPSNHGTGRGDIRVGHQRQLCLSMRRPSK